MKYLCLVYGEEDQDRGDGRPRVPGVRRVDAGKRALHRL